jgi:3-methyladenine DNA glycosylase/8-oxoguanine DNA glycosylase
VLPTGDFGIRMAIHKHYLERAAKNKNGAAKTKAKKTIAKAPKVKVTLPTPEQMEKIAKRWEPYRSIACWYLWRSLDTKTIGG